MPLVEVVRGVQSRDEEVKRGAAFVAAIDKFPLITKSVPGFLVNRVLTPYMFGAMQRLRAGRGQGAHRRGGAHLRHADGADRARRYGRPRCVRARRARSSSSRRKARKLDQLVAAGKLGKKTGEGFYVWKDGKPEKTGRTFDKAELERLGRELVEPMIAEAQRSARRAGGRERRPRRCGRHLRHRLCAVPRRPAALQGIADAGSARASRRRRVTFEPERQDEMQRFLRRVAVIGGARIPFCRSNTFYADLSNLDMMTGALNAPRRPLQPQGPAHRRGGRRRRRHALEGFQPDARGACSARGSRPRRPASP